MAQKKSGAKPAAPSKRARKPRKSFDAETAPRFQDVALFMGPTEDRGGFHILRKRADRDLPEFGTVRPLREGRPIDGEVIGLRARKDFPFVFDVRTEFDPHQFQAHIRDNQARSTDGPPLVANDRYRRGWDAIWGRKRRGLDSQPN